MPLHVRTSYGGESPTVITVPTEPGDQKIQGKVKLTVKRKRASIKMYEVSSAGTDLTARPDCDKGKSYTRGTPEQSVNYLFDNDTLAVFIHANVQLAVTTADGHDVTGLDRQPTKLIFGDRHKGYTPK